MLPTSGDNAPYILDLIGDLFPTPPESGPVDACPECDLRGNAPTKVRRVPNGFECEYLCPRCANAWTCSWWEECS